MPKTNQDWLGLITYPRVITYQDNHIYINIYPYIDNLFKLSLTTFKTTVPCKIITTLKHGDQINLGGYQIIEIYINDGQYVLSNIVYKMQDYFTCTTKCEIFGA